MDWSRSGALIRRIDQAFVALTLALFVANVLAWRGVPVFGHGPQFRPLGAVFLSGAYLLLALASPLGRRSQVVFYSLIGSAILSLWFAYTAR